jgi:hypothetical protein
MSCLWYIDIKLIYPPIVRVGVVWITNDCSQEQRVSEEHGR